MEQPKYEIKYLLLSFLNDLISAIFSSALLKSLQIIIFMGINTISLYKYKNFNLMTNRFIVTF